MVHFKIPNLSPALPHLSPSIYEDSDLFLGLQDNPGHRGVLETREYMIQLMLLLAETQDNTKARYCVRESSVSLLPCRYYPIA